jgi:hypothetical protein
VVGAIDGTHFDIKKPTMVHEDYFYFKNRGYSMQCQALVDRNKKFLSVLVGMPASTNNSRVLKCSSLHWQAATLNQLFDGATLRKVSAPSSSPPN